jgi:hypothetical protein
MFIVVSVLSPESKAGHEPKGKGKHDRNSIVPGKISIDARHM